MRRFTVVLAILEGLFMFVDGLHALLAGAYFAPGGQIGPWAPLVSAAGISPFSTGMKITFVALGASFMLSACAYALFMRHSVVYLSATAILTLWYLPLGTLLSLIVLTSMAAAKPLLRQPPNGPTR
jgi:hypothetical protein